MGLMAKALGPATGAQFWCRPSGTNQRRYLKACLPMGTMAANCKNTETYVRRRLLSSSSDKPLLTDIRNNWVCRR